MPGLIARAKYLKFLKTSKLIPNIGVVIWQEFRKTIIMSYSSIHVHFMSCKKAFILYGLGSFTSPRRADSFLIYNNDFKGSRVKCNQYFLGLDNNQLELVHDFSHGSIISMQQFCDYMTFRMSCIVLKC